MKSYLDQLYADGRIKSGMRLLMAAIVDRALRDIAGMEPELGGHETATAASFILSEEFRGICLEIGADYGTVKRETADLYCRKAERKFLSRRA